MSQNIDSIEFERVADKNPVLIFEVSTVSEPVKFSNPPLREVVFGAVFWTRSPLQTAHVGLFWETVKDKYPTFEELAPVQTANDPRPGFFIPNFIRFSNQPPLRRTLFRSKDEMSVIQLQEDRFLFNWKRDSTNHPYPGFESIKPVFDKHLANLANFFEVYNLGPLTFREFELTYVNIVTADNGLKEFGPGGIVRDCTFVQEDDRFLPPISEFQWASHFNLPDDGGQLDVQAQAGRTPDGGNDVIFRLDMSAKGISTDQTVEARDRWFGLAHEWITRGFADITNKVLQKKCWGRLS